MTRKFECALIGKGRILEADLWDRDYPDLVEAAHITFEDNGRGEFAFVCVQGDLDCEYSRRIIFFTWQGFDEMDEVNRDGSAELDEDGNRNSLSSRRRSNSKSAKMVNFSAAC